VETVLFALAVQEEPSLSALTLGRELGIMSHIEIKAVSEQSFLCEMRNETDEKT
jgi:hypothetical protein